MTKQPVFAVKPPDGCPLLFLMFLSPFAAFRTVFQEGKRKRNCFLSPRFQPAEEISFPFALALGLFLKGPAQRFVIAARLDTFVAADFNLFSGAFALRVIYAGLDVAPDPVLIHRHRLPHLGFPLPPILSDRRSFR